MIVGLLCVAVPVLWFVGAGMVLNGQLLCETRPSLPVCQPGTGRLVTGLVVIGPVVGVVIGLVGGIRAVNRGRKPHLWLAVAWVPPVVALVVSSNLASTEPRGPESTTAQPVRPAPVPAEADTRRWVWHPPEGMTVHGVVPGSSDAVAPGGAGVIVGIEDGVIALDGVTGKERWHYRSVGGTRTSLATSPDGKLVAFAMDDDLGDRTLVLDAMTGKQVGTVRGDRSIYDAMTNHTVTRVDLLETTVSGDDPRGRHGWDFAVPEECVLMFDSPNPVPSDDVATVGMACNAGEDLLAHPPPGKPWPVPVTITLVGLDDRTGAELWRYTRDNVRTADLTHAPDGTVLLEYDTSAVAIDPNTGATRADRTVRGEHEPIPAPGAHVTVDDTEVVGFA